MLFHRRWLIPAAALLASACGTMDAMGQNRNITELQQRAPECFTLGSLKGYYSVVATYGANVALAMGERYFDGDGSFSGVFLLNGPVVGSATGDRKITTGTQKGTYTINCDGSGVITRTLTASDGTVVQQTDNFQITKAAEVGDTLLATGLEDATQTPSALIPGGLFIIRSYNRLPDRSGPPAP